MKPKSPNSFSWTRIADGWWAHAPRHLKVGTSIDGDEYHISVSRLGLTPVSDADVDLVRKSFGMTDATEDNQFTQAAPGLVRHLWLKVPS